MLGIWGEQEAINAGLYPAPGSAAERAIAQEVNGIRGRGPSDLFGVGGRFNAAYPRTSGNEPSASFSERFGFGSEGNASSVRYSEEGYGGSWTAVAGAGEGGSTRITSASGGSGEASSPSLTDPSSWSMPSVGNVVSGMMNGPGGSENPGTVQSWINSFSAEFEKWLPRIILIVLGLVFVAVGLSLFGVRQPAVVEAVASRIPIPK